MEKASLGAHALQVIKELTPVRSNGILFCLGLRGKKLYYQELVFFALIKYCVLQVINIKRKWDFRGGAEVEEGLP